MFEKHNPLPSVAGSVARYCWRLAPPERGVPVCLSYAVEGNRIRVPGCPGGVRFPFPIGDVVETENAIVICLDVPRGRRCSENVFGIDHDGNLLWRVRPQILNTRTGQYVGLSLHGQFVRLHAEDGQWSDVDPRRGSPAIIVNSAAR